MGDPWTSHILGKDNIYRLKVGDLSPCCFQSKETNFWLHTSPQTIFIGKEIEGPGSTPIDLLASVLK